MINVLIFLTMFGGCSQEKWLKCFESNYEVSYPESWTKHPKDIGIVFLSLKENEKDIFQENVNVMVQDLRNQPMTLEEYTNLTKNQIIQALGSSAIVSVSDLNFAGQQAKEMVYTIPKNPIENRNLNLKIRQIWFIKGSNAYLITYTAQSSKYEKHFETARGIFDSFKLKG